VTVDTCLLCDAPLEGRDTIFARIDGTLYEVHARCEVVGKIDEPSRKMRDTHRALPSSKFRMIPR